MAQPDEDEDGRQEGDTRSFINTGRLAWWPARGFPFRWKPKHGNPECIGEAISQAIWAHRMTLYIAVVVTVILIVEVFDIKLVVW